MKDRKDPTNKARPSKPKGFDYGSIPVEDKKALIELVAELNSIARKSAEEVFNLGRRFADAKERLPKRFEEWVKKECRGISTKTVFNYISVHARFEDRRDEVLDLGLKPVHLYALANAPEPAIEEVFGRVGDGEPVIGSDVTRIIKTHSDPEDREDRSAADRPSRKGLLSKLKPITEAAVDVWLDRLAMVRDALLAALPDEEGGRVMKGKLQDAVMYDARWLDRELERLTGFGFENRGVPFGHPQPERLKWTDEGRWYKVSRVLWSLGGIEQIAATELEARIRTVFLPTLGWALGDVTADEDLDSLLNEVEIVDDGLVEDGDPSERSDLPSQAA